MTETFAVDAIELEKLSKQFPTAKQMEEFKAKKELERKARMIKHQALQSGKHEDIQFSEEIFGLLNGKASELQWFMFETRVRQVINEITNPLALNFDELKESFVR